MFEVGIEAITLYGTDHGSDGSFMIATDETTMNDDSGAFSTNERGTTTGDDQKVGTATVDGTVAEAVNTLLVGIEAITIGETDDGTLNDSIIATDGFDEAIMIYEDGKFDGISEVGTATGLTQLYGTEIADGTVA
jgi:hypothetical protein